MKEMNVFADDFLISFAEEGDLLHFLRQRTRTSGWIRQPVKKLRLLRWQKKGSADIDQRDGNRKIIDDTMKHTQMMLKIEQGYYPVRDCAIHTILTRAGIKGEALKRLSPKNYAKIVNMCLQTAKGKALIRFADGKISAVHAAMKATTEFWIPNKFSWRQFSISNRIFRERNIFQSPGTMTIHLSRPCGNLQENQSFWKPIRRLWRIMV